MDQSEVPTATLIHDVLAGELWLDENPGAPGRVAFAATIRRKRRELEGRGVELTPRGPRRLAMTRGVVVVNRDDVPGRAIHASRHSCPVVRQYNDEGFVRDAKPEELAKLEPCGHCLNDGGPSAFGGYVPFDPEESTSVPTVSGGAFEMNRSRH